MKKSNKEIKDTIEKVLNDLKQDLFKIDIRHINHKPHPYVIGTEHIKEAHDNNNGILDNNVLEKIRCDKEGCTLSYEEHTYDTVCALSLLRDGTNKEARTILQNIVNNIGKELIDGFIIVETKEKYRIT